MGTYYGPKVSVIERLQACSLYQGTYTRSRWSLYSWSSSGPLCIAHMTRESRQTAPSLSVHQAHAFLAFHRIHLVPKINTKYEKKFYKSSYPGTFVSWSAISSSWSLSGAIIIIIELRNYQILLNVPVVLAFLADQEDHCCLQNPIYRTHPLHQLLYAEYFFVNQ